MHFETQVELDYPILRKSLGHSFPISNIFGIELFSIGLCFFNDVSSFQRYLVIDEEKENT